MLMLTRELLIFVVAMSRSSTAAAVAGHSGDPIPGFDAVVNIGAPLALIWYCWTFFRDARRGPPGKRPP